MNSLVDNLTRGGNMIHLKDETGDIAIRDCINQRGHSLIPIRTFIEYATFPHDEFRSTTTRTVARLLCERCFKVFDIDEK